MGLANTYLGSKGYDVNDVSATSPFDLQITRGGNVYTVEAKGSSSVATTVELTSGEVDHAISNDSLSVLVVVDEIEWQRQADETVSTSGGRVRLWDDWHPDPTRLTPTRYRYVVPPGGEILDLPQFGGHLG